MSSLNPYELDGFGFLCFYCGLLLVAIFVAMVARRVCRKRIALDQSTMDKLQEALSTEEIGYLANGPRGAIDTAFFELLMEKRIEISGNKFTATGDRTLNDSLLQQAILLSAATETDIITCRKSCGTAVKQVGNTIRDLGLAETFSSFLKPRIAATAVMAVPITLGLVRIARTPPGKPFEFLASLVFCTLFVLFILLISPKLTIPGKRLLKHLKRNTPKPNFKSLESEFECSMEEHPDSNTPVIPEKWAVALPTSVAVFGATQVDHALCGNEFLTLLATEKSTNFGDTFWVAGGGDGGGYGGDGGGCGGGGCGGGGCGGCGG